MLISALDPVDVTVKTIIKRGFRQKVVRESLPSDYQLLKQDSAPRS
jgi:hypothetical protein